MNAQTSDQEYKLSALLRVLKATAKLPAQMVFYISALGAIALIPHSDLPSTLAAIAGGIGVNTLSSVLESIAHGKKISDDEIRQHVQTAIAESHIADLLTSDEFQRTVAKLVHQQKLLKNIIFDGQYNITELLIRQYNNYEVITYELKDQIAYIQDQLRKVKANRSIQLPYSYHLKLKVFIASPEDVTDERSLAINVIREITQDPLIRQFASLEFITWDDHDTDLPIFKTLTPIKALEHGLPQPSECDIFIAIIWSKMSPFLGQNSALTESEIAVNDNITEWLFEDAFNSFKNHGRPELLIYRRTEKVLLDPDDKCFDENYKQYQLVRRFFDSFQSSDGSWKQSYSSYKLPDEFRRLLELDLKILIRRQILEVANQKIELSLLTEPNEVIPPKWVGSPFRGLKSFEFDHANIFFGRGREIDELIEKIKKTHLLAVIGASGSGKSSLILAGLLPRLKNNAIEGSKDWLFIRTTPDELGSGNPFLSLAASLLRDLPGVKREQITSKIIEDPRNIVSVFNSLIPVDYTWVKIFLFIDQFEELFTLVSGEYRQLYIEMLVKLASWERIQIVLTLRADFYAECMEWPKFASLLKEGSYPLSAPGQGELYEIITRPAELAGISFEGRLVWDILEDTGTEPGSLALLSYTLDELFRTCIENNQKILTKDAYIKLGKVEGAIGTRAQLIYGFLEDDVRDSLPEVFQELVSIKTEGIPTRKRALKSRVTKNKSSRALVNVLTEERLLIQSRGINDQPIVEVAHEALFSYWPELRDWISQTKNDLYLLDQVKQSAKLWEQNNFNAAYLWPDERLKPIYAMIEKLEPDLSSTEKEFIKPELERLVEELEDPETIPLRRGAIGDRLCIIGDTRSGVELDSNNNPDISWCCVPDGEVTLFSVNVNEIKPIGKFSVRSFYISKYPVTFSQFQVFVDDEDGYRQHLWWEGLARKYESPEEQRFKLPNYPRETVNWYEAVAYCRWLTSRVKKTGLKVEVYSDNWEIRLPTEWEWQQAATGGKPENIYPWGPEWHPYANVQELGLDGPLAVGVFPQNRSLVGALDMCGAVWEWCLNKFGDVASTDIPGQATRVFRGGSFTRDKIAAQTIYRFHSDPLSRRYDLGFRLALVFS